MQLIRDVTSIYEERTGTYLNTTQKLEIMASFSNRGSDLKNPTVIDDIIESIKKRVTAKTNVESKR